MKHYKSVYDYPDYPCFIFSENILFLLHFQKSETQLLLYQRLCPCVLSSVLMQLTFLLQFYFGVEKLFSTEAVVTGSRPTVSFIRL